MKQIKIVQFGFDISGGGSDDGFNVNSINTELWALGEDGKLYAWEYQYQGIKGFKWIKKHDCIEVEDEEKD